MQQVCYAPVMELVHLPLIDMREAPLERSKVVSQALFAEEIQVLQAAQGWAEIQTPDGYRGWVKEGSFVSSGPYQGDLSVSRLKAHLYAEKDTEYGPFLSLPYGAKLKLIELSDDRWAKVLLPDQREAFIQRGDIEQEPFELVAFSKKFLGIPYTWGGRSSFGYDCSGFVQMVYAHRGLLLPRDARLQIADPRGKEVPLNALQPGDLIFWGKSASDIRHVGMSLGGEEFIHTSSKENKPYLRISQLADFEWSGHATTHYPYRSARQWIDL